MHTMGELLDLRQACGLEAMPHDCSGVGTRQEHGNRGSAGGRLGVSSSSHRGYVEGAASELKIEGFISCATVAQAGQAEGMTGARVAESTLGTTVPWLRNLPLA